MSFVRVFLEVIGAHVFGLALASPAFAADVPRSFLSRADSAPRKIVVASALADFSGTIAVRLQLASRLIDDAAQQTAKRFPGQRLDLMIFPEFAIARESGATAAERAVSVDGIVLETLCAKAREHHTWIVAPMTLRETDASGDRISNAAVLLNREGRVAGIFRKVHPIADEHGVFEGGVTPGDEYPVFTCDFGRLGILICWDMSYEDAWQTLAARGAEIVALPTASPQTLRPMAAALRHHYYVVNSAPRDNASVFDPIGRTIAQTTTAGVVVHQIDLAYAILHWSEGLRNGRALSERFGENVGYTYSEREDTGVFWSNDPQRSIGAMIRELGLREMPVMMEDMQNARDRAQSAKR